MPAFPEDLDLAQRCADKDPEAWRTLADRVGPRIRAIARRVLKTADTTRVDDAAAEVFAHFLADDGRPLRAYRGEAPLRAYLSVVAERLLWTRARWDRGIPLSRSALEEAGGTTDPDRAHQEERLQSLRKALDTLPARDRTLLDLLYAKGLTHREAAQALEVPLGTVATWSARARAALARKMGEA